MSQRMMSILQQTRSFENQLYSFVLKDLPAEHPLKRISLMQLKILHEIFHHETVSRHALSSALELPFSLLEIQLQALVSENLLIADGGHGKTVYRVNGAAGTIIQDMEQRFEHFIGCLDFRVGEMALREWDNILKLVTHQSRYIVDDRPECGRAV